MRKTKPVWEEAVRIGANHQLTIPRQISKALKLKKGDHMRVRLVGNVVELVAATLIPKGERWY